jgi:DHA2 family multidrug resistance protein
MGSMVSTFCAGRLVRRLDGRIMITTGFITLAFASFLLGEVNLQISIASIVLPNVISGLAMGMIFVPMTTMAMGTLPNETIGTATGLYNLMRGMGGSIGIAVITTLLSRHAQLHQSLMVSHLTPYDPAFRESLHGLTGLFSTQGDLVEAMRKAYLSIYNNLLVQSSLWAFIDNFRLLGYFSLLGVPLALLFKNVTSEKNMRSSIGD